MKDSQANRCGTGKAHNPLGRRQDEYAMLSFWHGLKQGPAAPIGIQVDVEALRARLRGMSDAKLTEFGKAMHELCYLLTYGGDGKPSVSTFSIQLDEARVEWLRRHRSKRLAQ